MNRKIFYLLISILFCLFILPPLGTGNVSAQNSTRVHQHNLFSMDALEDTTLKEGVAGSFFGKEGTYFLMAGGSSFPAGKPWQGGKKHLSNQVMIFQSASNSELSLLYRSSDLPHPMAEGASLSLSSGLLCMGGITPEGVSDQCWLLSYNGSKVNATRYPALPLPVKNASAALIGTKVYLAGGELADGTATNQFLTLDLTKPEKGWEELPALPLLLSGTAFTAQQDGEEIALFLFGGRAKNETGRTTFYSSVYQYKPSKNEWVQKGDIQLNEKSLSLAMATASAVGATHIMLYGGDSGETYKQVEAAVAAGKQDKVDSLQIHHPGFNKQILVYNTITDAWFDAGETEQQAVAVASAYSDGKEVCIAGGEKRPGVRSPLITRISFSNGFSFGWVNYAVLLLYFGGMLLMGFYFMKRNENTNDFFKAGGRIPWWAAGISIFATTLSAITFLSIPAKTYATDWRMLLFNICIILVVPVVIRYFMPFFRRFNLDTAYQYLEHRFSRPVRWIASALFVIFMVSRIAIVLFLPALALNAVTGFNIYLSIIVMGIVTIIYSTSGGMEAVVWGDVIQGFILIFGAIAAFIFTITGIEGGLGEFWSTSVNFHKFQTFDFRFDFSQPVFWVVLIGGVANSLITYTSDQSIIQRYMTTKNEKATANSIWLNGILSVPVTLLFFLIGTGLFAFYKASPEKMIINNANIDSVFTQFIVSEMPVGLAGLLVAAVFAAAMSTLSSNINSSAAVITADFFQTLSKKITLKGKMLVARWSGIICGLLGLGMALILATWNIASLWDQFNTFLGLLTSGLGALFILGIFFPKVGSRSALLGILGGLVILMLLKEYSNLSFLLYGFIGMASSILIALPFSILFPNKKEISGFTWKTVRPNEEPRHAD